MKQRHLTMMAMGGAVGTGLFVGSAETIRAAGPGALLSYALAGLLVLMVMRMLGEMVVARPMAGSFADYTRLALGDRAGFTIGWLYWYAFVAIVAIEAITAGRILHGWLPALPSWSLSLLVLTVMAGVNLVSVRSFGNAEFWFSVVKVTAILAFLAVGGAYVLGWWPGAAGATLPGLTVDGGFLPHGAGAVLTGTVAVVFAFGGTEIVTIAAAQSADPGRAVVRATRQVAWRIVLFFLCSVFLVVAIVPWRRVTPGESPYVTAMTEMGIPFAGTAMSAIILIALLSVLNSTLYASSRMLFALCRHGDAPRSLVGLNRRKVPARAILLGTTVGYVSVAAQALWPQEVFGFLLNSTGALLVFMYLAIALSHLRLRARTQRTEPHRLTFTMWGFPYLTYVTIAALLAVLVSMLFLDSTRPQLLLSLATLTLTLTAHTARARARALARTRARPRSRTRTESNAPGPHPRRT